MRNLSFFLILSSLIIRCGNGWSETTSRQQTPSAIITDAKYAYDHGNSAAAIQLLTKIIAQQPHNLPLRISLAYAINEKAGLSPLDLMVNLGNINLDSSNSSDMLLNLSTIIGLSLEERNALLKKLSPVPTVDEMRNLTPKLATLLETWNTICPVLPSSSFSAFSISSQKFPTNFPLEKCQTMLAQNQTYTSALFAATMMALSQGIIIYQTVLNSNDSKGDIELITRVNNLTASISDLQSQSNSATDPTAALSHMQELNTKLNELVIIGQITNGPTVNYAIDSFKFVGSLIQSIPGLPDSVAKSVNTSVAQFSAMQDKLASATKGASTSGTSGGGTSQPSQITEKVAQASTTVDSLQTKACQDPNSSQCAQFNTQLSGVCANFTTLKALYNLDETVQKPASCSN